MPRVAARATLAGIVAGQPQTGDGRAEIVPAGDSLAAHGDEAGTQAASRSRTLGPHSSRFGAQLGGFSRHGPAAPEPEPCRGSIGGGQRESNQGLPLAEDQAALLQPIHGRAHDLRWDLVGTRLNQGGHGRSFRHRSVVDRRLEDEWSPRYRPRRSI